MSRVPFVAVAAAALVGALTLGGEAAVPAQRAATAVAVFAGGCFWSMEHDLEKVPGVVDVVSGYTGGRLANPTYDDVVTETTGHREAVRVTYDPAKISYAQLVDSYFRTTDPTDGEGAFCDRGESYTPAIYATAAQRAEAEAGKRRAAAALKRPLATEVLPASRFYPAEGYHQDYAAKNPVRYAVYRNGCGKDRRLKALWGGR